MAASRLLWQVRPAALADALTVRHVVSGGRGSSYAVPLTPQQCVDARDALAKGIFSGLFEWLVAQLNAGMAPAGPLTLTRTPTPSPRQHHPQTLAGANFECVSLFLLRSK